MNKLRLNCYLIAVQVLLLLLNSTVAAQSTIATVPSTDVVAANST